MFDQFFDKLWEESPTVQKTRDCYYEAGELAAFQRNLISVVQIRFPDLAEFVQKQARLLNDPGALELLHRQMLTVPDSKSARWLLESAPEQ